MGGIVLIGFLIYLFKCARNSVRGIGSSRWPSAEAIVTADPLRADHAIEIPYSYRFKGELYTGLQEEPIFGGSEYEHIKRFPVGRSFTVRVRPDQPEISVFRDDDQSDGVMQSLQRIDEEHKQQL